MTTLPFWAMAGGVSDGLIEVEAHRGRLAAGGRQAAHLQLGLAGAGGLEGNARHLLGHFEQVGNALRLQVGARDGGEADRASFAP